LYSIILEALEELKQAACTAATVPVESTAIVLLSLNHNAQTFIWRHVYRCT